MFMRRSVTAQRVVSVVGAALHLAATIALLAEVTRSGILATAMGNWEMPFGITFVVDHLSAIMLVITGVINLAVAVYSIGEVDDERLKFGFHPFYHVMMMGVSGSFLTGDIFNLFVWFEVMLIGSFALIVLGNEKKQLAGSLKYVGLNLVSSVFFLIRSEEHTSELQSRGHLVCRLLLEKKKLLLRSL